MKRLLLTSLTAIMFTANANAQSYSSGMAAGVAVGASMGATMSAAHKREAATQSIPFACMMAYNIDEYKKCRKPSARKLRWVTRGSTDEYDINVDELMEMEWRGIGAK